MAEDCFAIKMNDFGERDHRLFAAVLSWIDLGNVDTHQKPYARREGYRYV